MIYSFLTYTLEFSDGKLDLQPAMSTIAEEIEFAKPKPPAKKPNIRRHVSLHGAYQIMVENELKEYLGER